MKSVLCAQPACEPNLSCSADSTATISCLVRVLPAWRHSVRGAASRRSLPLQKKTQREGTASVLVLRSSIAGQQPQIPVACLVCIAHAAW